MATLRLEDLPDELILEVFSFLGSRDLICMGQMSNRIRAISHDEQLWQKINLYHEPSKGLVMGEFMGMNFSNSWSESAASASQIPPALQRIEKIPARFLKIAINNGCKYLSLYPHEIDGKLELNQVSSLIYLKLHKPKILCSINYNAMEELLTSCVSLQKLSMKYLTLSLDMVNIISNQIGKTLQVLDLNGCKCEIWGMKLETVQIIVRNCINLKEVNFDNTRMSHETIRCLVENITPSIQLLSLNYVTFVNDEFVRILVNRCKELKTLNLALTEITDQSLLAIIETLKPSLEQLDIAGIRPIYPTNLIELRAMPKLKILIGSPPLPFKEQLQNDSPHLVIHEFGYSQIKHQKFLNKSMSALNKDGIWEVKAKPLKLFSS